MCGIFGAINLNGYFKKSDADIFVELTDLVNYRGPDAGGYTTLNTKERNPANENFNIFLGHRRLAIIDLSAAGNQPFSDGNGLWIVYNGEVFNYIELREDLKKKGHVFKTETDTEVILKVYREYGCEGFGLLNGMWAFAIVDVPKQKVILSRDRFSIKPLYFHRKNGLFYFASEIKQLLPLLESKQINQKLMFAYLKQGLLDFNDETFFQDVYKIKPMQNVVVDLSSGEIKESYYWEYSQDAIPEKEDDLIEQFREKFVDSVRIRLRSDVPIGCLLSGGLDSSSNAVIADKLLEQGINCFSIISNNKKYSEEKFINIVGSKKNIKINKLLFGNKAAWDDLEKVVWFQEEPFGGFSVVAQNQIYRLIKENSDIKVVLSGQGGDEILCGYRKYFFFYLAELLERRDVSEMVKCVVSSLISKTVLWQFSLSDGKRYMRAFQGKNLDPVAKILTMQGDLEPVWSCENLRARQTLDIDKYSVPALAHYEDRNSMAYSLEVRHPFLDHRLVDFTLNQPSAMKIKHGWTKYMLRKSISELPREIAWRRDKQGFLTEEEQWVKNDFKGEILDLFNTSRLSELDLIDKNELLNCYRQFTNGNKFISSLDISRFVLAEIWCRQFLGDTARGKDF